MTSLVEQTTSTRTQQTKLPDFFIIGHAKSGTTALYQMLRVHSQIYMPDLKETRFFARELHPLSEPSRAHPDTLADYLALFANAAPGQRAGEASPSYLRSRVAASRIAELAPNARIIAILREPASFVRSLHLQLLQAHVETERDLGKALAMEAMRRRQDREEGQRSVHQGLFYSEHVRYVEQLRRYYDVFPREQVLVLIYDDFRADNEGTVRRVLRFLEVDDAGPIEAVEANPSVRVRSPLLYGIVRTLYMGHGPVARAAKAGIKALTFRRMRVGALRLERRMQWGDPGSGDGELMLELRRRCKGEVEALSEYLDRDLVTQWGYRDID